ncbi:hypothetical protein YC2023_012935 [Brassica napus]
MEEYKLFEAFTYKKIKHKTLFDINKTKGTAKFGGLVEKDGRTMETKHLHASFFSLSSSEFFLCTKDSLYSSSSSPSPAQKKFYAFSDNINEVSSFWLTQIDVKNSFVGLQSHRLAFISNQPKHFERDRDKEDGGLENDLISALLCRRRNRMIGDGIAFVDSKEDIFVDAPEELNFDTPSKEALTTDYDDDNRNQFSRYLIFLKFNLLAAEKNEDGNTVEILSRFFEFLDTADEEKVQHEDAIKELRGIISGKDE